MWELYLLYYLKKCNFIYLTHPPPQGLNSLVLPIMWAEPAVVTVIIRIYGGQVLCVNHMLAIHASMHIKRKEEKKGKKGKESFGAVLIYCFLIYKGQTPYGVSLPCTYCCPRINDGVAPGTYEPAGASNMQIICDYLDTSVRPNWEIRFNNPNPLDDTGGDTAFHAF